MPFYEALEEMEAPEKEQRRDLREYVEYLDLLKPGVQHYLYVKKGEPVMRKVKAVDEKGDPRTMIDPKTGKTVSLYAVVEGDPQPTGVDGVEYVLEDTGRGKTEMNDSAGLVAAGAQESINVNVKAVDMGRGYTRKNPDTGVIEWVPDDTHPEKTRLRVIRSTKRPDNKEGTLRKQASLADRRMKDAQQQYQRATDATASFKKELQDKIKKYKAESVKLNKELTELLESDKAAAS